MSQNELKPLSEILDEIEAETKKHLDLSPPGRICGCSECDYHREKVALVKALRMAIKEFDFDHVFSTYQENLKADITSILNQGRQP